MSDDTKPKSKRGAHFTSDFQRYAQSCRTHESLSEAGKKGYQATKEKYPDLAFEAARQWRLDHPSFPEQVVSSLLKHLHIPFEREWRIDEKQQLSADFYLPETRQVIEVNSNLHTDVKQQERDGRKQELLKARGIPSLTLWDREILDESRAGAVTERIQGFVAQGRERLTTAQDQPTKQHEQPKRERVMELSR